MHWCVFFFFFFTLLQFCFLCCTADTYSTHLTLKQISRLLQNSVIDSIVIKKSCFVVISVTFVLLTYDFYVFLPKMILGYVIDVL